MAKRRRTSFQVYASRECIDNSERNSLSWCIWALAVLYSICGSVHVQVDKDETRFTHHGFRYVFPTPVKAARIAKAYDDCVLNKPDIQPWTELLENPISVEPSRHRRPKPRAKATKLLKKTKKSCTRNGSNRWGGRRI